MSEAARKNFYRRPGDFRLAFALAARFDAVAFLAGFLVVFLAAFLVVFLAVFLADFFAAFLVVFLAPFARGAGAAFFAVRPAFGFLGALPAFGLAAGPAFCCAGLGEAPCRVL